MKPILKMKLHPDFERWTGYCRITYTTRNEADERLIYCLQDEGEKFGGVRLMRCSKDGEPSHEVTFSAHIPIFERPSGDSRLERAVNAWIDALEAKGGAE